MIRGPAGRNLLLLAASVALLMIAGAGTFALDALQMKRRVQEAAQPRFLMASGQAMMKLALEGLAALVLAVSAVRTMKGVKVAPAQRTEARASSSLLMGRLGATRTATAEALPTPAAPRDPLDGE